MILFSKSGQKMTGSNVNVKTRNKIKNNETIDAITIIFFIKIYSIDFSGIFSVTTCLPNWVIDFFN